MRELLSLIKIKELFMTKEVFLLVNDDYGALATEVCRFDSLEELNGQLAIDSYGNLDDELKPYHGVLVPATFIPNSFKGATPYIYIPNPLGVTNIAAANEAHFEKIGGDPATVAMLIAELLTEKTYKFDNANCDVTIQDVFLFFGHKLAKVLQIPEDHLDEEIIDRVSNLTDSIDEHNKKLKEGKYEIQS